VHANNEERGSAFGTEGHPDWCRLARIVACQGHLGVVAKEGRCSRSIRLSARSRLAQAATRADR
jgi:hypothetical protein